MSHPQKHHHAHQPQTSKSRDSTPRHQKDTKSMQSEEGGSLQSCICYDTSSTETPSEAECQCCICPVDHLGIVIHDPDCIQYKHETIIYPHTPEGCECKEPQPPKKVCECCGCLEDECFCKRAGPEALAAWHKERDMLEMPAVLEADHPLMQKFQASLKQFLERENQIALEEITKLKDELNECKREYDRDLEAVYISDHDTNAQRMMIQEYEEILAKNTKERLDADERAKVTTDKYKQVKEKYENDLMAEREATEELEALSALCRQLEAWRDETDSDLTISHRMSEKMKAEKRALGDEKRKLDMILYTLSNEVWSLESKLELFKKQMQIKNDEMNKVNDRVTAYAAELEDLELDKKRLISLWNSVLANINQRDGVFDSVREDYKALQENYRTLINNLEITKKVTQDEMQRSKELEMNKDKINYDIEQARRIFDTEDERRSTLEQHIAELHDAIVLTERDQNMVKMENQTLGNILKSTEKELGRRNQQKVKLENEILQNLQDCLLNDKAVESMANGIKKMRDMSRKLEISLMNMETQHARVLLDIEVHRYRQMKNNKELSKKLEMVKEKEQELNLLEEKYERKSSLLMKKQRELDIVMKKYNALKEIYDLKSPQERRIEELEKTIKSLRDRTESLQTEWLRLQGHVVRLTEQHQKIVADINLISKQIQICDQKIMRIQVDIEHVRVERVKVDKTLRELRGRLEVLERTRKEANDRNKDAHLTNLAITHEYTANLKDAESQIIVLEEEIEALDKEKVKLTQELDKVQREALVWQRKGILAVELKRNIKNAKSAAGEIGQMKTEIHRMEVRREQLRRTSEKLSEDLAWYVSRRENALEKIRASAAVEKAHGTPSTSQSTYHHKLRMAKSDVARVGKDLAEAKARLSEVLKEQERLESEVSETGDTNARLEEHIASLLKECRETDRQKQWLLERVVRSQRLGSELATAVKRQSVKVKKSKDTVLEEFNQAKLLNSRIKHIVETLRKDYPYLEEKLEAVSNTLNIFTPSGSPRLTGDAGECERPPTDPELDETPVCQWSV